jgi:hypothetical protein
VLAGYGATSLVRSRRWPLWIAFAAPGIPLVANWTAADRARGDGATVPRIVASSLLSDAPRNALLFVAGDNDTYPLWYLQQVEQVRQDVTVVTIPLLPADWYVAELARRTRLEWPADGGIAGARWQHQETAARIAEAARAAGRPVAASPSVPGEERALLGSRWTMSGTVYVSSARADGSALAGVMMPAVGSVAVRPQSRKRAALPDDVSASMLRLLECRRIGSLAAGQSALRDSLEVSCNLR